MLTNIVTRMKGEVPIAWGLIYLVNNVLVKDKLALIGLPHKILDQFWFVYFNVFNYCTITTLLSYY